MLEWVAISFSRDLPDPGIKPGSPALQADSLPSEPPETSLLVKWVAICPDTGGKYHDFRTQGVNG